MVAIAAVKVLVLSWCVGLLSTIRAPEETPAPLAFPKADDKGKFRVKLHRTKPSALNADKVANLRGTNGTRSKSLLQLRTAHGLAKRPQPVHLFGIIHVGSPPQQFAVAFDTGSGNMILPSKICKSIACLSHRPYDEVSSVTVKTIQRLDLDAGQPAPEDGMGREQVKVSVGTGFAKGDLAMDRVCFDESESVCTMSGMIEAVEMSEEPFNLLPYDGILGLAMPGASVDMRFNVMGNLAEAGLLQRNMFAVWLAGQNETEDSEITFGQLDGDRVGSEIMWYPVSETKQGMWQITLADYYVNGQKLGLCGAGGCEAAFDTGTEGIAGPTRIITPLLEQLSIDKDCANYASLPTLGFQLGEYELNIEPPDYVQKVAASCWPKLNKLDLPPPVGPIMLLGDSFLTKYYAVYDRMALRMGVALAKHKPPSAVNGESLEDAAKRLIKHHTPSV